jgi:DNA repair ATPase RecN
MTIKILVKIAVFKSKLEAFRKHRQELLTFMNNLETAVNAIATVAWISPASKALLVKLQALLQTVKISLRIVEKYISDLEIAMQQFSAVEDRIEQKVNALKTDVFPS